MLVTHFILYNLTHWDRNKIGVVVQTTFSSALCRRQRAETSKYIPQILWDEYIPHILWDVITSPYPLDFLREQHSSLIARFMGPTWGPSGADRTQVGPMLAPWTLLSGPIYSSLNSNVSSGNRVKHPVMHVKYYPCLMHVSLDIYGFKWFIAPYSTSLRYLTLSIFQW